MNFILFLFIFPIEVQLIYNVVLIIAVQKNDSVIHIYIYILFHILFHYGLSQDTEQSSLCSTVGPRCLCIDNIIINYNPEFTEGSLLVLYVLWVWTNVYDMYPPLWSHTEQFFCPKNSLCPAYSSLPPLPHPPVTTDLFIFSIVLPFPERHRVRIIQRVAFPDGLLSLTHMHLRFFYILSWLDSSFYLSVES